MKIVISPAKSLDYKSVVPVSEFTVPYFTAPIEVLSSVMKKKSKAQLKSLMRISDALSELNYQRFQDFSMPFSLENSRQAVYAFSGDVYTGLDAYSLDKEKVERLQNSLRILSGFYGLLKPLDLMQPYRLEMGSKLAVKGNKNLYEFWGNSITEALNNELKDDELFLNLASKEYFKAIQPLHLKVPVISPVFKDYKNGNLKIISFFAKKARGSMVRYVLDTNSTTLEDIKGFDAAGYRFSEHYTTNENEPVFVR